MAAQLTIKLHLIQLAKKAAGSNPARQDAYISALTDNVRREFGKRCIDAIIERTLDGKDKNNKGFARYSEDYKKSPAFKIYGKSASDVNLKLSGNMQANIDVLEVTPRSVTLGFVDQSENDKAHGHVNGSNYLPIRDFWGISEKDQIEILKDTIKDFEDVEDFAIIQTEPTEISVGEFQIGEIDFSTEGADEF